MTAGKPNRSIVSTVNRLLFGVISAVVLIGAVINWRMGALARLDDLRYNYHNQSRQHIDRIRHQLMILRTSDTPESRRRGFRAMEAVHIANTHAQELWELQEQYQVDALRLLLTQYQELARPLRELLKTDAEKKQVLLGDQLDALILKLNQLERQHEIIGSRLYAIASEMEHGDLQKLLLVFAAILSVFSVVTFRLMRNIRRLVLEQEQAELALFEEKEYLRITLTSIGDAVITTNEKGLVTSLNPVAEHLTGWTSAEAKGVAVHDVFPIIDATTREGIANPVDRVIATGEVVYLSNHTTLLSRSGNEYQIADSAAPIRGSEDGIIRGMVLVFNDVTEQYRLRQESARDRRDLKAIMDFSPSLIQVRDLAGRFILVNRQFELAFEQAGESIVGHTPSELLISEHLGRHQADFDAVIATGAAVENREGPLGKNLNRTYMNTTFPLRNGDHEIYAVCSVSHDITMRKQQEEKILHQAHYDALTELPNRFLCLDRLTQKIKDAKRQGDLVAVLFIDLDDFKKVNDSLGHETGDKLLVSAAKRLRSAVRNEDTVGRLGGDEFLVLLNGVECATDVATVADSLIEQFRRSFLIDGREILLTMSVGLSLFPNDGGSPSQLLRNADTAMYHAKEGGRNTYSFFTEAMNVEVERRLELEEQLHGAMARKEFSVVFQPQVDIPSGKVVGAEVLLRWRNVALGSISPAEFIPVAEQIGLITQLGNFVLGEALSQVAVWRRERDPEFQVSVNVSPRQFKDPEFVADIAAALEKHGVPGKSLELEITEGVLLAGQVDVIGMLESLRALGAGIALDDFGTGYSSLNYLRTYPFNSLKVDRSFVSDMASDESNKALVGATVAMARALGLSVVAEGVENAEQLMLLGEMSCDTAQGYFLGEPVAAGDMTESVSGAG